MYVFWCKRMVEGDGGLQAKHADRPKRCDYHWVSSGKRPAARRVSGHFNGEQSKRIMAEINDLALLVASHRTGAWPDG